MTDTNVAAVLAYCRAGFESECGAEIAAAAKRQGIGGRLETVGRCAYVLFHLQEAGTAARLNRALRLDELVFARQLVLVTERLPDLPAGDRVAPMARAAARIGQRFSAAWLETADTNEAKELSTLCRRLSGALGGALQDAKLLSPGALSAPRLHLFFVGGTDAYVGLSLPGNSSPWPMGIPRLKMPRDAPSRSTLKLAEALIALIGEEERDARLRAGMRAVDLGAAPGGWSWQMARRGVHVIAVDNGPMAASVIATGMVEHLRADGFTWRPRRPADWLLCDMAAQPARIAALAADWIATGQARATIFNLKLPMKKRLDEVDRCRAIVEERLKKVGLRPRLRLKHLYHDREEVTGYLRRG